MHTCLDQYHANKAANGNGGLRSIMKGGGYYSECNKRLESDFAETREDRSNGSVSQTSPISIVRARTLARPIMLADSILGQIGGEKLKHLVDEAPGNRRVSEVGESGRRLQSCVTISFHRRTR